MDITNGLLQFIPSQLIIVCVVLFCIGIGLKSIKPLKNEWIPFILGALGILFAIWHTKSFSAEVVMQGIICAAVATYAKNIQKQFVGLLPAKDLDQPLVELPKEDAKEDAVEVKEEQPVQKIAEDQPSEK